MVLLWRVIKGIKRGLLFLRVAVSLIQTDSLDKICFKKLEMTEEPTKVKESERKCKITNVGEHVVKLNP